jgi:hypothetical protein
VCKKIEKKVGSLVSAFFSAKRLKKKLDHFLVFPQILKKIGTENCISDGFRQFPTVSDGSG